MILSGKEKSLIWDPLQTSEPQNLNKLLILDDLKDGRCPYSSFKYHFGDFSRVFEIICQFEFIQERHY